jgi:hypothetical protein
MPPPGIGDADHVQQLDRPIRGLVALETLVPLEHLGDLGADPDDRVQRRHRILEDHRDLPPPQAAALLGRHREQVLTGVLDQATDLDAGRREQSQDR